jgi:UDP-2-acetamido-3-amino-2,3-dideoxy-glucuronate N-acetyltransferase
MNYTEINLAIIGSGKWGMNHVKTANSLLGGNLKIVCDFNPSTEDKIKAVNPSIKFTTDINEILNDAHINAVIIATPAETHFDVAFKCLNMYKNVLVEKPITLHSYEAKILHETAEKNNLKLMVGHVLLFHPAIIKIKEELIAGRMGKLQYLYSNRLNLGTVRTEENILWSFAPHDISIIQYLTDGYPESIDAKGAKFLQSNIEDTTITYLNYPGNVHAHIFVSWLHPFKEQRLVVIGDKGMFVFDDVAKDGKLKFYPKGFEIVNGSLQKFDREFEIVHIEEKPPLAEEQKHFFNSIIENKKPLTDGLHALQVLQILEEAQKKLAK